MNLPSMRLVGYRQVWRYLDGQTSYQEMQEHAIVATRQLAKRQITWCRSESLAEWYDPYESGIFNKIWENIHN